MKAIYSNDGKAVLIYGDRSPWPVAAEVDVVEELGGEEETFHTIKLWTKLRLLVRHGSQNNPLSLRDIQLTRENEAKGERYWRFEHITQGNEWWKGYCYPEGDVLVFPDFGEKVVMK